VVAVALIDSQEVVKVAYLHRIRTRLDEVVVVAVVAAADFQIGEVEAAALAVTW